MQWTAIHRRVKHDLCLILGECLWAIKIEWQNLKNLRSVLSHLGWRTPVVVEDDVVVGGSIDCIKDHDSTMVPSTCCAWVARAVVVVHLWKAMLWWVGAPSKHKAENWVGHGRPTMKSMNWHEKKTGK